MIFQPEFEDSALPLAEYPRPQCKRASYFPLNGTWEYAIRNTPTTQSYDGEILVPYSPETELSGVNRQLKKDEYLFYRKNFSLPEGFIQGRVFLHIGACDQVCKVFLNGALAGGHEGGYYPFSIELTEGLQTGENELLIVVRDDADSELYGRGKQKYKRGGIWYTATSGIWQSAWLESTPVNYLKNFRFYPDVNAKTLRIRYRTQGEGKLTARVADGDNTLAVGSSESGELLLDVSECKEWTTETPELYKVFFSFGEDEVESYFGLREFSVREKGGYKYFALNGKPVFHNGLLDQGYFLGGAYTPSSNRAIYEEIKAVRSLGFNMLRKHAKVESALWYYYCDILGVLVWQDMVNGGGQYPFWRIALCPFFNLRLNDKNYKLMKRNEASRKQYYAEAYALIDALFNCVSLCLWTPFNEAWGQFDALEVCEKLKKEDPTRLFDHASGWQDKGGGDVCSRHIYFRKARPKNDKKRVLALTEFGGYSRAVEGHTFSDKKFGYKTFKSAAALENAYEKLYREEVFPLVETQGLCATVYTQLTDIEDEINGLFTFDRVPKIDGEKIRALNRELYGVFEKTVSKTEVE
ncbi:MAG: glycoside hydrolase family 2 [Clostridia bacterium]|nr:glycoside hydrolase family 2 [Clostridia bacterium]